MAEHPRLTGGGCGFESRRERSFHGCIHCGWWLGRVAQWQSVCMTHRMSGVRFPLRPRCGHVRTRSRDGRAQRPRWTTPLPSGWAVQLRSSHAWSPHSWRHHVPLIAHEWLMSWAPRRAVERVPCGHPVPDWRWRGCGQDAGFCVPCQRVYVIREVPRPRRRLRVGVEVENGDQPGPG